MRNWKWLVGVMLIGFGCLSFAYGALQQALREIIMGAVVGTIGFVLIVTQEKKHDAYVIAER